MSSLLKWVSKTAAGVALMIAWWTIKGPPADDPNRETASAIPATVWEGGGGRFAIEADTTTAARIEVSFEEKGETGDERWLEASEEVAPGHHSWTIDVPSDVGGYVALEAVDARAGDEVRWTLAVNGEAIDEQWDGIDEAVGDSGAFIEAYVDDYATGTFDDDD
jgi:hypothetical protein